MEPKNNQAKEKLAELAKESRPSDWREKATYRQENRQWLQKSIGIALKILEALESQKMSKADLAKKMNVSRQHINDIVKGRENLTLKTIVQIEIALNIVLIPDATSDALIYNHNE